ncbi:MAG: hypothetical protein ABR551_00175 [Gemmatimonadales bacterium]
MVVVTWLVAFLAVGLPYWSLPYAGVNLPNALPTLGLLVVGGFALFLVASRRLSLGMATGILATTVPAAVLFRVIVEVADDPTSHNLWPFELVIAGVVGVLVAGVGGLIGRAGMGLTNTVRRGHPR